MPPTNRRAEAISEFAALRSTTFLHIVARSITYDSTYLLRSNRVAAGRDEEESLRA